MKSTLILFALAIGFVFATNANAQTPVVFAKGTHEKTMTITVKPKDINTYSLSVRKDQVINVSVSGDIAISKTEEFPVIGVNLTNGVDNVDQWQDGEGYLSVLTGATKKYVIAINNSDKKRARTFKITFKVTSDRSDYAGGEEAGQ